MSGIQKQRPPSTIAPPTPTTDPAPAPGAQDLLGNATVQQLLTPVDDGHNLVSDVGSSTARNLIGVGNDLAGMPGLVSHLSFADDLLAHVPGAGGNIVRDVGFASRLPRIPNVVSRIGDVLGPIGTAFGLAQNAETIIDNDFNLESLDVQMAGVDTLATGLSMVPVVGQVFGTAWGLTRFLDDQIGASDWIADQAAGIDTAGTADLAEGQLAEAMGDAGFEGAQDWLDARSQLAHYEDRGAQRINELLGGNMAQHVDPDLLREVGQDIDWHESYDRCMDTNRADPMAFLSCGAQADEDAPPPDVVEDRIDDAHDAYEDEVDELREQVEAQRESSQPRPPRRVGSTGGGGGGGRNMVN